MLQVIVIGAHWASKKACPLRRMRKYKVAAKHMSSGLQTYTIDMMFHNDDLTSSIAA